MNGCQQYSYRGASQYLTERNQGEVDDLVQVLREIDTGPFLTDEGAGPSKYKTTSFATPIQRGLQGRRWQARPKVALERTRTAAGASILVRRHITASKNGVGLEVCFNHYAHALYAVYGKFPLFRQRGLIDVGILVIPVQEFAKALPAGLSYYEQVIAELEVRQESSSDTPTLVLGVSP